MLREQRLELHRDVRRAPDRSIASSTRWTIRSAKVAGLALNGGRTGRGAPSNAPCCSRWRVRGGFV
ncbi:MAG: hypothetical protein BGO98_01555 [Myxococcales bacterium 68-20]|nr:MAG: hypothetical protein BGO98_01555 [Myxococcales bacterium 68-20]